MVIVCLPARLNCCKVGRVGRRRPAPDFWGVRLHILLDGGLNVMLACSHYSPSEDNDRDAEGGSDDCHAN